jgi:hypothetical protein
MVQVGHIKSSDRRQRGDHISACGPYVFSGYSARKYRTLVAATRLCLDQPCREFDRMNNEEPDHPAGVILSQVLLEYPDARQHVPALDDLQQKQRRQFALRVKKPDVLLELSSSPQSHAERRGSVALTPQGTFDPSCPTASATKNAR